MRNITATPDFTEGTLEIDWNIPIGVPTNIGTMYYEVELQGRSVIPTEVWTTIWRGKTDETIMPDIPIDPNWVAVHNSGALTDNFRVEIVATSDPTRLDQVTRTARQRRLSDSVPGSLLFALNPAPLMAPMISPLTVAYPFVTGTVTLMTPASGQTVEGRYSFRYGDDTVPDLVIREDPPWSEWFPITYSPSGSSLSIYQPRFAMQVRAQQRLTSNLPAFQAWSPTRTATVLYRPLPARYTPTLTVRRVSDNDFTLSWTFNANTNHLQAIDRYAISLEGRDASNNRLFAHGFPTLRNPGARSFNITGLSAILDQHGVSREALTRVIATVSPEVYGSTHGGPRVTVDLPLTSPEQVETRTVISHISGTALGAGRAVESGHRSTSLAWFDGSAIATFTPKATASLNEDLVAPLPAFFGNTADHAGLVAYNGRLFLATDSGLSSTSDIKFRVFLFDSKDWFTFSLTQSMVDYVDSDGDLVRNVRLGDWELHDMTVFDDSIFLLCKASATLSNGHDWFLLELIYHPLRLTSDYRFGLSTGHVYYIDTTNDVTVGGGDPLNNLHAVEYADNQMWFIQQPTTGPSSGSVANLLPFPTRSNRALRARVIEDLSVQFPTGTTAAKVRTDIIHPHLSDHNVILTIDSDRAVDLLSLFPQPTDASDDAYVYRANGLTSHENRLIVRLSTIESGTSNQIDEFVDVFLEADPSPPLNPVRKIYELIPSPAPPAYVRSIEENITRESALVSWGLGEVAMEGSTPAFGNTAQLDGWELQYRPSSSVGWLSLPPISAAATNYVIEDLIPNTTYNLRLRPFFNSYTGVRIGTWRDLSIRTVSDQTEITRMSAVFTGQPDWAPSDPERRCGLVVTYDNYNLQSITPLSSTRFEFTYELSSVPDVTFGPLFDQSTRGNRLWVPLDPRTEVPYDLPCTPSDDYNVVRLKATGQLINEREGWRSAPWHIESLIRIEGAEMTAYQGEAATGGSQIGDERRGQPPTLEAPFLSNVEGQVETWGLGWTRVQDAVAYQVRAITSRTWSEPATHYAASNQRFFGFFREGHGPSGSSVKSLGQLTGRGLFSPASPFAGQPPVNTEIGIGGVDYTVAGMYGDRDADIYVLILFGDVRAVLDHPQAPVLEWRATTNIESEASPDFRVIPRKLDPSEALFVEIDAIPLRGDNGGGHTQRTIITWSASGTTSAYGSFDPRRQASMVAHRIVFNEFTGNDSEVSVSRGSEPRFQVRTVYEGGFVSEYGAERRGESAPPLASQLFTGTQVDLFTGDPESGFDQDDPFGARFLLRSLGLVSEEDGSSNFSVNFILQAFVIVLSIGGGALAIVSTPNSGIRARVAYGLLIGIGIFMGVGLGIVGIPVAWVALPLVALIFFGFLAAVRRAV